MERKDIQKKSSRTGRMLVTFKLESVSRPTWLGSSLDRRTARPPSGTSKLANESLVHSTKRVGWSQQNIQAVTATLGKSVRVYDNNDGQLLLDIENVNPWHNTSLLWSNDQLFIVFGGKIEASIVSGSNLGMASSRCQHLLQVAHCPAAA